MGGEAADVFTGLYKARSKCQPVWMRWARATPAFCILLPLAVLAAWIVVTATDTEAGIRLPLIVIGVAIALLTVSWVFTEGPEPSSEAIACLKVKHIQKEDRNDKSN